MTAPKLRIGDKTLTTVFFFLLTLVFASGGYWYYRAQVQEIRQRNYESIASITRMKVGQIVQWRKERLMDVAREAISPGYIDPLGKIAAHTETPAVMDRMRQALVMARNGEMYALAIALSPSGQVLLSAGDGPVAIVPATQRALTIALAKPGGVISDFFCSPDGEVYIDTVEAVREAEGNPLGFVVLRSRAKDYLYPLIQSWPTPSNTAETLLGEREGEEVVFLNELRHRSGAALFLRQSLARVELPLVQAILGRRGMFDGKDYRGVLVLADLRPVPQTSWCMVTKVDQDEILAEARYRAAITCVIVGGMILLSGVAMAWAYKRRQAGLLRKLLEAERKQRHSQEQFRTTLYSIGDGVLTTDTEGCVRRMNPVAERLTGWTEAEARGRRLEEVFVIVNQLSRETVVNPVAKVLQEGVVVGLANHTLLIARDGSEHAIADSAAPIRDENGDVSGVVLVFSDVSEEYRIREALRRSEEEFRLLFEGMLEGFALHEIMCDGSGKPVDYRFLSVNPAFERMTGLRAADIVGRTVREVMPEIEPVWIERYGRVALTGEPVHFEQHADALGQHFTVAAFRPQPNQFAAVFDDITERKAAEARIARLTQLYAALSQCNQAIVHSASVEELLPQICRDVVKFGGMKMAWIGMPDEASRQVVPAASYGDGTDYLDGIDISLDPEVATSIGPTPTAIRTNEPVWCQDFQNDPRTAPWHERAARYGWGASASLPLCKKGKPVGALTLYACQPHAFDEEMQRLLVEMAFDISFALDNFDREAERRQTEALMSLRLRLVELSNTHSMEELLVVTLDEAEALTGSQVGFFHFLEEDQNTLSLQAWSTRTTREMCQAVGQGRHYDVNKAGVWVDCIHQRRPVIHNDYAALAHRKELPPGHAPVIRELVVPVFRGDKIVAILGVGNKPTDYREEDVKIISRLADFVWDIVEHRRAEEAMRKSETLYRSLFENMLNGFAYCQMLFEDEKPTDFIYLAVNAAFTSQTGLKNVGGKKVSEVIPGIRETDQQLLDTYGRVAVTGHPEHFETFVEALQMWFSISVYSPAHGYFVALFDVITERKWVEERLKLQSGALEAAANAILIANSNGIIEWVNTAFTSITGYSAEEAVGKKTNLLKSGKHDEAFYQRLWETILAGEVWSGEIMNRRKDGTLYMEDMTITPMKDAQGAITHFIAVKQDITERKQLEENLLRTQRMESIGTLASGVAHDLNNILTPIILSADMLRVAENPANRENLISSIEKCAQRGAEVVNQVLTFARGTRGERITLQLERLVGDIQKIIRETFPKNITITSRIVSGIWGVKGDPTQMHQVLLNLCINARDAMPNGGVLSITGENMKVDEHFAALSPDAKPGDYAVLSISDTGNGIPRDIIGKIFDPFFTTKEVGKGTGLGLSTVLGIVRSHGGFVMVESHEGRGIAFKVFLPVNEGIAVRRKRVASREMPRGEGEMILVVDDEIPIVKVTLMMLESNGYKVLSANDASSALTLYRERSDEIQIVLTDIMMPGMDGVQLCCALKEINPQVKIIATTGQPTESHQATLRALGVQTIMRKPYDARILLSTLREALDEELD